ncbi:dipeptidyl peptidase IV N-terminal region-domain-containing protein [Lipomyces japonicus]|uniref:dipeptidyl peptidase IV N-terminal region-domain-containing protein n=1 Tax=Lipomyces japonicus TaxID=56871 RepID=UPI0034CD2770
MTSPGSSTPQLPQTNRQTQSITSIRFGDKRKTPVPSVVNSDILTDIHDNNNTQDDNNRASIDSSRSSTSIVFDQIESTSNSFRAAHFFGQENSPASSIKYKMVTSSPQLASYVSRTGSASSIVSESAGSQENVKPSIRSKRQGTKKSSESERLLLASLDGNGSYADDDDSSNIIDIEHEAGEVTSALDATTTNVAVNAVASLNANVDQERAVGINNDEGTDKTSKRTKRIFIGGLIGLVGFWVIGLIFYLVTSVRRGYTAVPPDNVHEYGNLIQLDDVLSGTFRPQKTTINWLNDGIDGHDGLYSERNSQGILVGDYSGVTTNDTTTLVDISDFTYEGKKHIIVYFWAGFGLEKVLLATDIRKNWRHSYYAEYWIYDVNSKSVEPLIPNNQTAEVRLATWSPTGDVIAYVLENNLYIRNVSQSEVYQITSDGGPGIFYGIPDWVYEEEVFSGNSALWWSDSGRYLAFLRSNDTTVPEYTIPYFQQKPISANSYPEMVDLKYPKAGYDNPIVELVFLDLSSYETFVPTVNDSRNLEDNDKLITEVVWAGEKVIVRQTNRESDLLKIVLIDSKARTGSVVREDDIRGKDGGWFEVTHDTKFVAANKSQGRNEDGYIDTIVLDGYNHLAYFSPLDASSPKQILTTGNWEVVDAPSAIDFSTGVVYFLATKKDPTERHVYSVKLDGTDFKNVTNVEQDGYYDVSFSTGGGYLLLSYNGPNVPWQKLLHLREGKTEIVEENKALAQKLKEYEVPQYVFEQVETDDGVFVNTMEIRPPNFEPGKKYPVLFHIYGGPGSQTVDKRFTIGFEAHVASELGAIVVSVDGRGTGFMGRKFRSVVRDRLGYWEARDQIVCAQKWANKSYVDESKIAIWGWSYGGYMTLKTLEQDGGEHFKYGMAVAPVTDWRFYDSIYTERYMHTPTHNTKGYEGSAISNVTALKSAERFLVMHGTGDDNVHFQNTLALVDKFDLNQVENYDMYVFPDSDHSIYFHNANKIVYDRLDRWIELAFKGVYADLNNI